MTDRHLVGQSNIVDKYIYTNITTCNVCPCTDPKVWTVTDLLMEGWKFVSALTECTGDRHFTCITRLKKGLYPLTDIWTSRAAPSQLKKDKQ